MSVFECSICLDSVQDPVVTLCGHLFCRPCLDKWLQIHSRRRECPVCKSHVDHDKLVPIYGNPGIPSPQPETASVPPELTYARQDRTCNPLSCAISSVWNSLVKAIYSVWSLLVGVVSSVWNTLVVVLVFVWSLLFSAVSSVWNLLFSAVSSIWNIFVDVISAIWNCLLDAVPFVWNALVETECLWTRPHVQRNKLAFLTICFIGFLVLYIRVSSWFS